MFNELSELLEYPFYPFYLTNHKMCYHFRDGMFHLSLLEFCITVLPFEPQGSQEVESEPHIHQYV